MHFKILYVEDQGKYYEKLEKATKTPTKNGVVIELCRAESPEAIEKGLTIDTDLVLADCYFPPPGGGQPTDRLADVIRFVRAKAGRRVPIIAYTLYGREMLEECLRQRDHLYDIWDKSLQCPEYVAWRLETLAVELTRIRPDTAMLNLIRSMESGASWHEYVKIMVDKYDHRLTEWEQIREAWNDISPIAEAIGIRDECHTLWGALADWEKLGRAAFESMRGHLRHSLNVFWLGYYLIHHPVSTAA